MIRISERSIYTPIIQFLEKELKAKGISEPRVGRGFVDIFFQLNSTPFIVEIKFGGEKEFAQALAQVYDYAIEYGTKNVIVLVFPKERRGQVILDVSKFYDAILSDKIAIGWIHTDYWSEWVSRVEVRKVLRDLAERFRTKIRKIDFNSIVKAIRESVKDLHSVIRQAKTGEIFEEVATKLELFTGLGEIKKRKEVKAQVSMLASYLLFNQLLFYHVYRTRTKDESLPDLRPIKSIKELKKYFSKILDIDYQPIYEIRLIDKIPERKETIELINRVIKNLILIRVEHITQDLAGRFFHALLPKEVAKVWAAFYTNPLAAEILANLAIDRWDETVLDPACGSGTLLAAAYRRKLELYEKQTGKKLDEETLKKLHKKFIEEDLTGIDIMPFAAHLTTINLASQRIDQPTNVVRVARMDSLELAPKLILPEFKKEGISIKPFTESVQMTLVGKPIVIKKEGAVLPSGKGKEFKIRPVDVVIMNPPFSDRQKLPSWYRENLLKKKELEKICGHQINLWGYFIALTDLFLKKEGKIAAVLPINLLRGGSTEKVRKYILRNYWIKYILKPTKDLAFSESASFRDILFIAQKTKVNENSLTKIIFIKKSLQELTLEDVKEIVDKARTSKSHICKTEKFEIYTLPQSLLLTHEENLMPLLSFSEAEASRIILSFLDRIDKKRMSKLKWEELKYGFPDYPAGLSQIVFVIRPTDKSREKRAFLLLQKEDKNYIEVKIKGTPFIFKIEKKKVAPALKTITGIKSFFLGNKYDYLIVSSFKNANKVIRLSHWKDESFEWNKIEKLSKNFKTYLAIPRRFNLYSPNTHVLAIFSSQPFIPTNKFLLYINGEIESCKLLSIFFNSVLYLLQLCLYKSETTGQYIEVMKPDLVLFDILDVKTLKEKERKELLELFEKIKDIEFPSILTQLEKRFWARVELDKTILKILGFSDKEIEKWLPKIYDIIVKELKVMRKVR